MSKTANSTFNSTLTATNSTAEPIVVASVKDDPKSGLTTYAQQLTTVSSVIAGQGQGAVTLDQSGQAAYNLIAMRAKDLFPVANWMAVVPLDCSSQPSAKCTDGVGQYYADLTIATAEAESMQQALKFYQTVSTFPGLEPGLSFIKLIDDCTKDSTNAESRINAFFQKSKKYSKCTLESFVAVQSYCLYYAFAWANFQDHFSYEVAQVNSDADASEGLLAAGKIVFTKNPSAPTPADVHDCDGGYEIIYHPVEGNPIPLVLVNGSLVNSKNEADLPVNLFFSYGPKSNFTDNDDDNTAWPVLIGAINQSQVIAVGTIEASDSPVMAASIRKFSTDWKQFYSPKSAKDWSKTIGLTAGLVAGLGLVVGAIVFAIKVAKQGRPDADTRVQDFNDGAKSATDALIAAMKENEAYDKARSGYDSTKEHTVAEEQQKGLIRDTKTKLKGCYEQAVACQERQLDQFKNMNSSDLEAAADTILEIKENLKEENWDTFKDNLPDIKDALTSVRNNIAAAVKEFESELDLETIENLKGLKTQEETSVKFADDLENEIEEDFFEE